MKIALASARLIDRDIAYNLSQMERFMKRAKAAGGKLICFGETFLQGFCCFDWYFSRDREMAISVDSAVFGKVCALSAEIGIDVLFGFAELDGEAIFSSAALIAEGGLHHLYRRISKGWKEYTKTDGHYQEGTAVETFSYGGKTFAVALCGDLWDMPERFSLGEEVLLWPVYISYTPEEWAAGVGREYAEQAQNCCKKVLLVNSLADGDAYGGAFAFSEGKISAGLEMGREGLLMAEV